MKRTFIAYKVVDGQLILHDHPIFTGHVAYDLGGQQDIQVCEKLDVREFMGQAEVIAAVQDYFREHPAADQQEIGDVVLLERFTFFKQKFSVTVKGRKPGDGRKVGTTFLDEVERATDEDRKIMLDALNAAKKKAEENKAPAAEAKTKKPSPEKTERAEGEKDAHEKK